MIIDRLSAMGYDTYNILVIGIKVPIYIDHDQRQLIIQSGLHIVNKSYVGLSYDVGSHPLTNMSDLKSKLASLGYTEKVSMHIVAVPC